MQLYTSTTHFVSEINDITIKQIDYQCSANRYQILKEELQSHMVSQQLDDNQPIVDNFIKLLKSTNLIYVDDIRVLQSLYDARTKQKQFPIHKLAQLKYTVDQLLTQQPKDMGQFEQLQQSQIEPANSIAADCSSKLADLSAFTFLDTCDLVYQEQVIGEVSLQSDITLQNIAMLLDKYYLYTNRLIDQTTHLYTKFQHSNRIDRANRYLQLIMHIRVSIMDHQDILTKPHSQFAQICILFFRQHCLLCKQSQQQIQYIFNILNSINEAVNLITNIHLNQIPKHYQQLHSQQKQNQITREQNLEHQFQSHLNNINKLIADSMTYYKTITLLINQSKLTLEIVTESQRKCKELIGLINLYISTYSTAQHSQQYIIQLEDCRHKIMRLQNNLTIAINYL